MPSIELHLPFDTSIDLIALADVLGAAAVTVHVLLKKYDVRAAIGWIGLAWLSPFIGAALYYVFGINRVMRRAARLTPESPDEPTPVPISVPTESQALPENILTIARVGAQLTGHSLVLGNSISLFSDGDEAYPAMLDAIAAAQRSIILASYIFRKDRVGGAFIDALSRARRRGVEIRVLVDGIGSGYMRSRAADELRRADIKVARFMHYWLPWRMPFLNMRNHKKLLVVDGSVGFSGGLNIGVENLRRSPVGFPVTDVHFRLKGPVVAQLMLTFAEDWKFTTGEVLTGELWLPHIAPSGSVAARGISSGPDEDMGKLELVLAAAVAAAKQKLRIVTPYFLPEQRLMAALVLAALRGVQVEIVIPERSDHIVLDWAMRAHLGFFTVPGLTVYLSHRPFDHSKLVTVDGVWCALGSPNWDVRSLRLNFEFLVECYGVEAAAEVDRLIDRKVEHARPIPPLATRSLALRLRDAGARLLLPYL
jgi:cardiolipin synthase